MKIDSASESRVGFHASASFANGSDIYQDRPGRKPFNILKDFLKKFILKKQQQQQNNNNKNSNNKKQQTTTHEKILMMSMCT